MLRGPATVSFPITKALRMVRLMRGPTSGVKPTQINVKYDSIAMMTSIYYKDHCFSMFMFDFTFCFLNKLKCWRWGSLVPQLTFLRPFPGPQASLT